MNKKKRKEICVKENMKYEQESIMEKEKKKNNVQVKMK